MHYPRALQQLDNGYAGDARRRLSSTAIPVVRGLRRHNGLLTIGGSKEEALLALQLQCELASGLLWYFAEQS